MPYVFDNLPWLALFPIAEHERSLMSVFLLTKDGPIATLTFNRPEKRNPLNVEVLLEMEGLLHSVRDDPEVRVLMVTGSGNSFCAGADLSALKGVNDPSARQRILQAQGTRRTSLTARVALTLRVLDQMTIAAINGYAVGGGWMLSLACDFRIAVEHAEFWFPEVDLGVPLVPEGCRLVVELVGPARAKEIILTCRRYKAAELQQMGMVHQVVPAGQLDNAALSLAQNLADKKHDAVGWSKATVNALTREQRILRSDLLLTRA
jgi:enoyl-CoA hydratase